jgi:hypothetical protein
VPRWSTAAADDRFVHGLEIPAHIRWAETEAMIRAGEWSAP